MNNMKGDADMKGIRFMTPGYFILNHDRSVKPASFLEWTQWFERVGKGCQVGLTKFDQDVVVSTVFFGLSIVSTDEPPLVFETIVFMGRKEILCWRYGTWQEAETGHHEAVDRCRIALEIVGIETRPDADPAGLATILEKWLERSCDHQEETKDDSRS